LKEEKMPPVGSGSGSGSGGGGGLARLRLMVVGIVYESCFFDFSFFQFYSY
jgi:hypothetical protein